MQAKAAGAVVFSTLQYPEGYMYQTYGTQTQDFGQLATAGADVVSGSQGHHMQSFGLRGNSFIHYGVGNLYFDQVKDPRYELPVGVQQNFIDRYLVYDNKLLGVELLATFRDGSQQPRPLTPEEKRSLLKTLFDLSDWQ